jgi:hypothetical protein
VAASKTPSKVYITRVFNLGTFEEWQAMKKHYPRRMILDAVRHPLAGQWNSRAKAFAEVLFDLRMPKRALISYDV